ARGVFGPALGVEWALVAAAFGIGAACTLIAAARLSGSLGIALLVTVLEILIYPRSFGYPKILLYAVAALVMMALARRVTVSTLGAAAARGDGRGGVRAPALAVAPVRPGPSGTRVVPGVRDLVFRRRGSRQRV